MPAPRTLAAIWSAKTAAIASRRSGRGGGTAVGGLVALRVDPGLIGSLARQIKHGSLLVTGTNGKTTTSRLIAETARAAGLDPLANSTGSNLTRGIAATLATAAGAGGSLSKARSSIGVFEVDEATVPLVLSPLRPRAAVFTNLFRDQLDRYGEVEYVAALWRDALATVPSETRLVLNADDPSVASLGEGRSDALYFGIEDATLGHDALDHASDALNCRCGARLIYEYSYFGHLGAWRCEACGRSRPEPQVRASEVQLRDGRSLAFVLSTPSRQRAIEMGVGGLYNVYNAVAAATAALALHLPDYAVDEALTRSASAFGRQESFEVAGRRIEVVLAKNPAGLNQVLSTLTLDPSRRTLLAALNDLTADGRDISWIWDADLETAAGRFETVIVSGTRADDMALRLKYADWREDSITVERNLEQAFDRALSATAQGETLTVVPTYTAMLALRELIAGRAGRAHFWEQSRAATEARP